MVKAKIDVNVSGVDRTIRKIKRDLHRGMEQSADTLVDNARKEARRVISEERAIFNSEVYSGFRDAETKNTPSQVSAKLYNNVEHAEVLEEGATFPAQGPPVAALLPWVARKMNWGSSFDPDIYGGSDYFDGGSHGDDGDDGDGGSNDSSPSTSTPQSTEVVDENTLDEDTTEDGLTLSRQGDDMALSSGDIQNVHPEIQKETLWELDKYQRLYGLPKVDSIREDDYGDYNTIEEALEDDNSTIVLPDSFFTFDNGVIDSEYLYENDDRLNVRGGDNHLEYVIDHQYGKYTYDNLTEDGLNAFRKAWGFEKTDSGWNLPEDASDVSEYAATSERIFFAEVFVDGIQDNPFVQDGRRKQDFFERIKERDSEYFTQNFLDLDNSTQEYRVGIDYSDGLEVVLESQLEEVGDLNYTTDFNYSRYNRGQGLKEYQTYVVTSDIFEGAKEVKWRGEGIGFLDEESEFTYDFEDVTLQAISQSESQFNDLESGSEIVIEEIENMEKTGDYLSIEMTSFVDRPWTREYLGGKDVFFEGEIESDGSHQITPNNLVGRREDHPDLWADGIETVQTVSDGDLGDEFVESTTANRNDVVRTVQDNGFTVIQTQNGDSYRVNFDTQYARNEFKTLHPNEDGDYLEFEYDYKNPDENDIDVTHVSEKVFKYNSIEEGDNLVVNPDEIDENSFHSDSKYRATVYRVSDFGIQVRPFGSSTLDTDTLRYDSFVDYRKNTPGWDANDLERGDKVSYDTGSEWSDDPIETGRVKYTRDNDLAKFKEGQIRVELDDGGGTRTVNEFMIESFESDDFMSRFEEAPDNMDFSLSEYSKYDSDDTLSMLNARDYKPLEGVEDLADGTDVITENEDGFGEIYSQLSDGRYRVHYYDDNDEFLGEYVVEPEKITRFDGQGIDYEDVSEGDTISTGSSFGEILNIREDPETGEPAGMEIDFNGDGKMDDLLSDYQVKDFDTQLPKGTKIWFWDHRAGEMRTGTVRSHIGRSMYIKTEDGQSFSTSSNALYPATPLGYK